MSLSVRAPLQPCHPDGKKDRGLLAPEALKLPQPIAHKRHG